MDEFARNLSVQSKKAKKKSHKTPKKKKSGTSSSGKVNGSSSDDIPKAPSIFDIVGADSPPASSRRKSQRSSSKRDSKTKGSRKQSGASSATADSSTVSKPPTKGKAIKRPPTMTKYDGTPYKNPFKAWMNPPKKHAVTGSQVTLKVPKKTDFQRTSTSTSMDNAPFFWHKVVGDFECLVHVSGDLEEVGQKAGLMIRIDPENWVTSALEHHRDNILVHSTTITKDTSDTSFVKCPVKHGVAGIGTEHVTQKKGFSAEEEGIWLCAKRLGNVYESYFSTNGQAWILTRQGLLNVQAEWVRLGIFGASRGSHSFEVTFDMYECHVHKDYD